MTTDEKKNDFSLFCFNVKDLKTLQKLDKIAYILHEFVNETKDEKTKSERAKIVKEHYYYIVLNFDKIAERFVESCCLSTIKESCLFDLVSIYYQSTKKERNKVKKQCSQCCLDTCFPCNVCLISFCPYHHSVHPCEKWTHRVDEACVPYFKGHDEADFFKDKFVDVTICRAKGCGKISTSLCSKKLCDYYFCDVHKLHKHFKCSYGSCEKWGTAFMPDDKFVYCYEHALFIHEERTYYYYYNQRAYNRQTVNTKCCDTCHVALTTESEQLVGFCRRCNGMWQALKSKGIKGPFG